MKPAPIDRPLGCRPDVRRGHLRCRDRVARLSAPPEHLAEHPAEAHLALARTTAPGPGRAQWLRDQPARPRPARRRAHDPRPTRCRRTSAGRAGDRHRLRAAGRPLDRHTRGGRHRSPPRGVRARDRPLHVDRALHLVAVGALVGCFTVQIAKSVGMAGPPLLLLAASSAAAGVRHRLRAQGGVATWASYTAILPVLAVGSFLVVSPGVGTARRRPRRPNASRAPRTCRRWSSSSSTSCRHDRSSTPTTRSTRERFPNLATFAGDATWYRHSSSLSDLTEAAVPAMLTGNLPVAEEAVWTNHPDNLFTILAPTHELEVIEQATGLCPYEVCAPTAAAGQGGGALDVAGPGFGDMIDVARDLLVRPRLPRRGRAAGPRRLRGVRDPATRRPPDHDGGSDEPAGHRAAGPGGSPDPR